MPLNMKKILLVAAAMLCLSTACNRNKDIDTVIFEYVEPECNSCARTSLQYPITTGKNRTERKINAALEKWVISTIDLTPEDLPATVQEAATEFKNGYMRVANEFPDDYHATWENSIRGELCYQDDKLLAFCMETYSYTGGAHGYRSSHYLLFDTKKGALITREELIKDVDGFTALAEQKFREHYASDTNTPLNEQGFMFENDQFHLPDNIGFTNDGLKLIYNPYEIAPYSSGQITLEIPYSEVNAFLGYQVGTRS